MKSDFLIQISRQFIKQGVRVLNGRLLDPKSFRAKPERPTVYMFEDIDSYGEDVLDVLSVLDED